MANSKEDLRKARIERMNIKPGSSYHRVMVALSQTEGFQRLLDTVGERIVQAKVVGHKFAFHRNYSSERYDTYPYCIIDYGMKEAYTTGWSAGTVEFTFPSSFVIPKEDVLAAIRPHWGTKDCPTFNCAWDVIAEKFPDDFGRIAALAKFDSQISQHKRDIAEQWSERRDSAFFKKDRVEARATACIKAIRGQVEEYYRRRTGKTIDADGAADTLRRAAEELLSQDVLDS